MEFRMPHIEVLETADKEWTAQELIGDVYDECLKTVPSIAEKYKFRAVFNKDMMKPQYVAETICMSNNLVVMYNNKGNIDEFDRWIHDEVKRIMSANLVGGKND